MESMRYMQPGDYFNQEEIQQFVKIAPNKKEIGDIVVYDFKSKGHNPLSRLAIVEVKKEVDRHDEQYVKHLIQSDYFKGTGFFINSNLAEHIPALIAKLAETDESAAQKILNDYHNTYIQSEEAITTSQKMLKDTNLMFQYLEETNIKVKDLNIDIESLNKLSDDEKALEKELNLISKNFPKPIKIDGYNDSDYYPYMFENFYVIEDVSADRMFICKKEGNKTSWYETDRWTENVVLHDWINETLYEHHQLPKSQLSKLNEFNLVVEYEGEQMTKATVNIDNLNILQGCIIQILGEEGKIDQELPDLSFEELLQHYTFQKEFYHIEERAIVELLQEIKVVDGKMTYDDFGEADPFLMKKAIKHEQVAEHHMRELLPPKQSSDGYMTLDMRDFSGLKNLEKKHVESINEYLTKLQERDNTEMTSKFISLIQAQLPEYKASLKRRLT